jgi:hypothetical protein
MDSDLSDAMLDLALAGAQVKRAASAKFGTAEFERVQENRGLHVPDVSRIRETRYKVDGDTAAPIDTAHVKYVGGGVTLKRIDGSWKLTTQLPSGTDKALLRRQLNAIRTQAKALTDIAAGVESGTYSDADAMADAIDAANRAAMR